MPNKRKALDQGGSDDPLYKNRLPGNFPYEQHFVDKPEIPYTGEVNPAMADNRPIADPDTDLGTGDLDEGLAFRIPMER